MIFSCGFGAILQIFLDSCFQSPSHPLSSLSLTTKIQCISVLLASLAGFSLSISTSHQYTIVERHQTPLSGQLQYSLFYSFYVTGASRFFFNVNKIKTLPGSKLSSDFLPQSTDQVQDPSYVSVVCLSPQFPLLLCLPHSLHFSRAGLGTVL